MCCVCQERQAKFTRAWLCGWCWHEYPELQRPVSEWPEWARELKRSEENERRLSARTPYTRAAYNILEGSSNEDPTGGWNGYFERPEEGVWQPIDRWGAAMRAALGEEHEQERQYLDAEADMEHPASVRRAMAAMHPDDRRVLEMRYFCKPPYTQAEIADALHVSQPTARARLNEAFLRLGARLEAPDARLQKLADEFGKNLARVLAKRL
jgi:DNA-directed RNA polymerase specialized sigma24 family protein